MYINSIRLVILFYSTTNSSNVSLALADSDITLIPQFVETAHAHVSNVAAMRQDLLMCLHFSMLKPVFRSVDGPDR